LGNKDPVDLEATLSLQNISEASMRAASSDNSNYFSECEQNMCARQCSASRVKKVARSQMVISFAQKQSFASQRNAGKVHWTKCAS
jgi:hypothetical protein